MSEVRVWAEFLSREPSPEGRIEYAISYLHSMYVNSHLKQGAKAMPLDDFLLFKRAWDQQTQQKQTAAEAPIASVFSAFGKVNRKR